jgi:hypothetical protein
MPVKTTAEERRSAVAVARRLLDANEPLMLDVGEVDLLCRTLLDVQSVFVVHAPLIAALKKMHNRVGEPVREFTDLYHAELVPALLALHRFDAFQPKESTNG